MNSGMETFQRGKIEYCSGTLEFDAPVMKISAKAGEEYHGYFRITVHAKQAAIGYVRTNDYRIQCSERKFRGKNLEVPFTFDTLGLERGDTVKGEFYIISNMGEYYLPYEVRIETVVIDSELGEIKNLFHFANLAKTNWQQGLQCFYQEDFIRILTGSARQYVDAYKGLYETGMESGHKDFAMEQFLILTKKKQAVTFEYPEQEWNYTKESLPERIEIRIRRNGWGYTSLSVISEGAFLMPKVTHLSAEDFHNDEAVLVVAIHPEKLHVGRNTGMICLDDGRCRKKYTVSVDASRKRNEERIAERQKKQLTDCLLRLYLDYRTGRKSGQECAALAEGLLSQARDKDALMPALYQAHLKLLTAQTNEADWLLKRARKMMEGKEMPLPVYGYFLYLTAMSGGEESSRAGELLERYAEQYPDEFVIYWGCMHREKQNHRNPGAVYRKLKDLWDKGCFTPILYLETAMVLLENPIYLAVMDAFEVQVLLFMERYGLLTTDTAEQIYTAAGTAREYHPLLLQILEKYRCKDKKKMLKVLCQQYMRGDCKGKAAKECLKEGILEDCRITGIYEAYIRALAFDTKETLPREVVRYFAYDTALDEIHLAYVYAKVVRQQENISGDYETRIRQFVRKELLAGKLDENLAYLYRTILMPEDMTEDVQERLLEMVFMHEVIVEQPGYRSCIVRHAGVNRQEKVLFRGNRALVPIYTQEYTLLFEDENGLCSVREKGYKLHELLGYERMKGLLKSCQKTTFEEQFYKLYTNPIEQIENREELEGMHQGIRWLLQREELSEEFRKELSGSLLRAYSKWNETEELDAFLLSASAEDFAGKDRMEFVTLLCTRGFYDKAFAIASSYGYEKVDNKILARLCQFIIEDMEGEYDRKLVRLAYRVFDRGKYTLTMIAYLAKWFQGTVKQMRNVWKSAVSMDVEATAIAERILEQLVFAGAYTSDRERIFQYYCEHDGRRDLIRDYLSMRGEEYFVRDEAVEDSVFEKLMQEMSDEDTLTLGAGLALLKYNSGRTAELSEKEKELCIRLLGESLGADIYFPYYRAYVEMYPVLEVYGEKSYVEYRTKAGNRVVIHYILDKPGEEEAVYCHELMREIYPGIYQKDFRLFWGEILQYYITEEQDEEESFAMSGRLEMAEHVDENGHGRFCLLNDIALAVELRDYDTADALSEEYMRNEFLTAAMLKIK